MKPILKYLGGKSREIKFFEKYIKNEFDTYVEPFFGGGALYFHLEPKKAIINDVNMRLVNFYKEIKTNFDSVSSELSSIEKIYDENRRQFEEAQKQVKNKNIVNLNQELYYSMRDMFNGVSESKYLDATIYYFINKTAYSGIVRYNQKGLYNVPYGKYKNFNTSLLTKEHEKLLKTADIYNEDYIKIFNKVKSNDFMFLDPPYDTQFSDYGNAEFTGDFKEEEHIKLAEDFKQLSNPTLMVIGSTPFIEELYFPFIKERYMKKYTVNAKNRLSNNTEHLIITNY